MSENSNQNPQVASLEIRVSILEAERKHMLSKLEFEKARSGRNWGWAGEPTSWRSPSYERDRRLNRRLVALVYFSLAVYALVFGAAMAPSIFT